MKNRLAEKRILTLFLVVLFFSGYYGIGLWAEGLGRFYTVGLPWEEHIPFVAPAILGYCVVFLSLAGVYLVVPEGSDYRRVAGLYAVMMLFHYIIFVVYPVKMIWRPEITDPHGFFGWFSWLYFKIDRPYNCFPSLHVAEATLALCVTWKYRRLRWLFIAAAILTPISVVLVKQHYILDAVAGAFAAWGFYRISWRLRDILPF